MDVLVLFASQTGNAERVAQAVWQQLQGFAVESALLSMGEADVETIRGARDVLLVVSTCGEGDMPDSARALWQALATQAPDLQGVHFALLALGDCLYDDFCGAGKRWDARLAALGAVRLRERVDCDVEYEADAQAWTQAVLAQLADRRGWSRRVAIPVVREEMPPGYSREDPLAVRLLERQVLTGAGALREVVHVELDVCREVTWTPGDIVYIWPENPAELVAQIIAALDARGADQVSWQGRRERLDTLLARHLEVSTPSPALQAALGLTAQAGADVLECLRARPVLDAQDAVELLKPLSPRAYSIANVQGADHRMALTVGHVQYERHGRWHYGAASHFLATAPMGTTMRAFLAANRYFSVPADGSDMIMIATGTGIAPFRGFLQERAQRNARGRNWLFFGERQKSCDFLYGNELQLWQENGVLDRLDLAFSRDQHEKVYVQHLLRAQGAALFAWLEAGAFLFVCGSKAPMAEEVDGVLHEVVAEHGNMPAANAAAYIARLKNDKRYVRDVY